MKNTKFIIFVVCVSLLLSAFSLSCFAYESGDLYGDYIFARELDFNNLDIPNGLYADLYLRFDCNGLIYDQMSVVFNSTNNSFTLNYWYSSVESTLVYSSDNGWVDDSYRYISIIEYGGVNNLSLLEFLNLNQYIPDYSGWFFDIKDMLYNVISDGEYVGSELEMVITLVSVIFCLLCVSIPVLVVLFLIKYVLGMRFY